MPQVPGNQTIGYNYKHISTLTTTVVKSAPGCLHGIFFGSATSGAVITIYDNTSATGTVLSVITLGAAITTPSARLFADINFTTGLTIVTATQLSDMTVLYT